MVVDKDEVRCEDMFEFAVRMVKIIPYYRNPFNRKREIILHAN